MTLIAEASRRRSAPAAARPRIAEVDPLHPDAQDLLALASQELQQQYPSLFGPGLPPPTNLPGLPRSAYLLAYVDAEPAGSAALHPLDAHTAEVRRVFVAPPHRRRGVARLLMQALDDRALALGYRLLRLETGERRGPAISLYQGLGWQPIEPFGVYAEERGCRCFEKAPVANGVTIER